MRVKRFAAVALAGVMGMSMLAGCGDSGKDESTTAAKRVMHQRLQMQQRQLQRKRRSRQHLQFGDQLRISHLITASGYRQHVRRSRKSIQTGISHLSMVHVVRVMLERL